MKPWKSPPAKSNTPWRSAVPILLFLLITASIISSCYEIRILFYDPEESYNGLTFFTPYRTNLFYAVDMEGNIVTEFELFHIRIDTDFKLTGDGKVLIMGRESIYTLRLPNMIEWLIPAPSCHHSLIQMSNGHLMYLFYYEIEVDGWDLPFHADGIREVDPWTGEVIWEWRSGDYLSTDDYCPWHIVPDHPQAQHYDWTHANAVVYRAEESAVYMNIRHLDRLVKIDYPSGEILWSMGRGGDFGEGLFRHAHDPEFLENGNILIYDNGNHRRPIEYSRAIEIAYEPNMGYAEVVWQWPDHPWFFDHSMGDANRLPNGNTLITSSHQGKIYEVTRTKEIVWTLHLTPNFSALLQPRLYKAVRSPFH